MGYVNRWTQLEMDLAPDRKKFSEMDTQESEIREWLMEGHCITPLEALERWGCFRLAARIHDLREQGLEIVTSKGQSGQAVYRLK